MLVGIAITVAVFCVSFHFSFVVITSAIRFLGIVFVSLHAKVYQSC